MIMQGCAPYTQSNAFSKSCNSSSVDADWGQGIRAPENREHGTFFPEIPLDKCFSCLYAPHFGGGSESPTEVINS